MSNWECPNDKPDYERGLYILVKIISQEALHLSISYLHDCMTLSFSEWGYERRMYAKCLTQYIMMSRAINASSL